MRPSHMISEQEQIQFANTFQCLMEEVKVRREKKFCSDHL